MAFDSSRSDGVVGKDALTGKRIVVVGGGRAAVAAIRSLLSLPISELIVSDDDPADKKDEVFYGAGTAGMKKVHALGLLVHAFRPDLTYRAIDAKITPENKQLLRKLIRHAHALIWAADDWQSLCALIVEIHMKIKAVAVSNSENGAYVELAWSDFQEMPCLRCSMQADQKRSQAGVGSLDMDIALGGNLATRLLTGLLLRDPDSHGFELFTPFLDRAAPLLVLSARPTSFARSSNHSVPQFVRKISVTRRCEICKPKNRRT